MDDHTLFTKIAGIVEEVFFDQGFLSTEWPRIRAERESEYAAAASTGEREAALAALVEAVGVSHAVLITPELNARIEELTADPRRHSPVTERYGETLVVTLKSFKGRTTTDADLRAIAEGTADAADVVLDLRLNDGGSGCVVSRVARLFLPANIPVLRVLDRLGRADSEPHILFPFSEDEDPDHEREVATIKDFHHVEYRTDEDTVGRFRGNVVVLLGERCYSCGEVFAQAMKEYGRATLVGTASAGAVVAAEEHELGDGYRMVFPFAKMVSGKGYWLEGRGVSPHIRMEITDSPYAEILDRLAALRLVAAR